MGSVGGVGVWSVAFGVGSVKCRVWIFFSVKCDGKTPKDKQLNHSQNAEKQKCQLSTVAASNMIKSVNATVSKTTNMAALKGEVHGLAHTKAVASMRAQMHATCKHPDTPLQRSARLGTPKVPRSIEINMPRFKQHQLSMFETTWYAD